MAAVRVHTTFRHAGYTPKPEETERLEFRGMMRISMREDGTTHLDDEWLDRKQHVLLGKSIRGSIFFGKRRRARYRRVLHDNAEQNAEVPVLTQAVAQMVVKFSEQTEEKKVSASSWMASTTTCGADCLAFFLLCMRRATTAMEIEPKAEQETVDDEITYEEVQESDTEVSRDGQGLGASP